MPRDPDRSDAGSGEPADAVEPVATETIRATGHEHVRAEHESTLEVTTDDYLTPAGDCIVGIEADRAPADLDPAFVEACQSREAQIETTLVVDDATLGDDRALDDATVDDPGLDDVTVGHDRTLDDATTDDAAPAEYDRAARVVGRGDPELTFESERGAVFRTSDYVDERTVAVDCDRAAADLDRELVRALADGADLTVHLAVTRAGED